MGKPDPQSFAVFILTHGRPGKVLTHKVLRRAGYTGPIYLILDDEDETADQYREKWGAEWCLTFSKAEVAQTFDEADRWEGRGTIVYARNASFSIAKQLGLDYFMQLDDDYTSLAYRLPRRHDSQPNIRSMDAVIQLLIQLLEETGALTVAMAQGGDNIGGIDSNTFRAGYKRKAMNSFLARTSRPIHFLGKMNEDVSAYCLWGSRGELFLQLSQLQLTQERTQQTSGGMTEAYLQSGTYVKSFYTVMMCPSFVAIKPLGQTDMRLHHRIIWDHAVPKILDPQLRRES